MNSIIRSWAKELLSLPRWEAEAILSEMSESSRTRLVRAIFRAYHEG